MTTEEQIDHKGKRDYLISLKSKSKINYIPLFSIRISLFTPKTDAKKKKKFSNQFAKKLGWRKKK